MTKEELCALAVDAMKNAYVPYSGFTVGAALLTSSGKVYTGCNIENASFTPTVCAERTAIFKAVSEGERKFEMIAVAGGKGGEIKGEFPPCGVCRHTDFRRAHGGSDSAGNIGVDADHAQSCRRGKIHTFHFAQTERDHGDFRPLHRVA